jgi:predicted  nucleic acid-binding Zn-ribbon protein
MATITQGLIDHRFQVKPFLRELVMTQRYRLGQQTLSQQPEALESIAAAAGTSAAALAEGDRQAIQEAIDAANDGWIAAREALAAIEKECVRLVKERDGGEAAYLETVKKTAEAVKVLQPLAETADKTAKKLAALQAAYQQLEVVQSLTSPEDAALVQTLQQLGARRDVAATEATTAEAARVPAQQAVDTARSAEDAAQKHLVALATQLDSQRSAYEAAQQSLLAARRRWEQSTLAMRRMERQAGVLAKRQAWESAWQSYQQIARTVAPIQRPLEELKRLSANDATMRQGLAGKLAEFTAQRDPMQQKLQTAQSQAMQFQRAADAWKASLTQLQSAQQLLAQVSDFQPLVAAINQQLQVANTQLGTAQLQAQTLAEELKGIDATILQHQQQIGQLDQSLAARQPQIDALATTLEQHRAAWDAARGSLLLANRKWIEEAPEAWVGSPMRPLSPEQYCASCLQISGHLEQHVLQERKAIDEAEKVPEGTELSPEEKRRRDRLATRRAIDKLRGNFDQFATLYSAGAGQPEAFFATAEQALFLANGGAVSGWSGSNGSNATARVILAADADAAAEELYQSLLARSPTVEEKGLVAEYWNGPAEQRPERAQELVWAILCGVEFRFVQ